MKTYSFREQLEMSKRGVDVVAGWLELQEGTQSVENVEGDVQYQKKDVDLIWRTQSRPDGILVEVKSDTYAGSGNFFFETISNIERFTPGCFLTSRCDVYAYLFESSLELYLIPMTKARLWFMGNMDRFFAATTSTRVGRNKYTSEGYLVPRRVVVEEVDEVQLFNLG